MVFWKRWAILSIVLLVPALAPPAWAGDEASKFERLIEEMEKPQEGLRYQAVQTVHSYSGNKPVITRFRVQYSFPHRKRECISGPQEDRVVLLEDGKYCWRYFPSRKTVIKEPLKKGNYLFPVAMKGNAELLLKNYELDILGPVPSGGTQCMILEFEPKWPDRPRRQVWLEERHKVLMRDYVFSRDGRPVYLVEKRRVTWDPVFDSETFMLKVPKGTKLYEVKQTESLSIEEAQKFFSQPLKVPLSLPLGYRHHNIILQKGEGKRKLQFVYTDGLSSFSIFHEPGLAASPPSRSGMKKTSPLKPQAQPKPHPRHTTRRYGLINVVSIEKGDLRTIFVGDLHVERLLEIAGSLSQHKAPEAKE